MREKIIDDLAGMMGGAAGLLSDIRDQVRGDMRDRMKMAADRIDLVTRDDLAVLESRIAALEALLKPKAVKTAKAAPAPKKAKAAPAKKKKAKK